MAFLGCSSMFAKFLAVSICATESFASSIATSNSACEGVGDSGTDCGARFAHEFESSQENINVKTLRQSTELWNVPGVGRFAHFANSTFQDNSLPSGLYASGYRVNDTTSNGNARFDHIFIPENVVVSDGSLCLKVPGGQVNKDVVECAEVGTTESDILYASVRTKTVLTKVPGVVQGLFFYHSDCQEIDIEYLSDSTSLSNPIGEKPPIAYTNQALSCNQAENTHAQGPALADLESVEHDYRIDWTKNKVVFYIDNQKQKTFDTNVPTEPGSWLFNVWANGDPGFSVGSPAGDAVLKISNIIMYYNRSIDATAS